MKRITTLLVEDHVVVRQGLRMLIEADGDIEIVGETDSGRKAVLLARDLRPDVIVMDIAMPSLNGLQATYQILKLAPEVKVLILSAHDDPEYIDEVLNSGASGYLVKQCSGVVVAKAIRELHKGHSFFSDAADKALTERRQRLRNGSEPKKIGAMALTSREAELLQLIAEGHLNKQIADELNISIKTVEKHRQHLMDKLNIHDIAGLTRFAISTGVIANKFDPFRGTHRNPISPPERKDSRL